MSDSRFLPNNVSRYTKSCVICEGDVVEQRVTVVYPDRQGGQRVIHNVPAGVCQQCGERYISAEVALAIERILGNPPQKVEEIGASDFATAV